MNIILIIILSVILFVLIIGYNIVAQQKWRAEQIRRQEMARYIAMIDATEELLANANNLPYSNNLLLCLNNKVLEGLTTLKKMNNTDPLLNQKIKNINQQITQIKENPKTIESTNFRTPENDNEAISMLKIVKRLRSIIKAEHTKGRLATPVFVSENDRLEQMQMKINIENVLKRVTEARLKGHLGTAQQLLKKSLEILATKNDAYSLSATEHLEALLKDVSQNLEDEFAQSSGKNQKEENSELDALFAPKKKW